MPVPLFSFKRAVLRPSCLLGLAAATWYALTAQTHFMDMAGASIVVFVGTSIIAVVFIFLALAFYHLIVKSLLSDN